MADNKQTDEEFDLASLETAMKDYMLHKDQHKTAEASTVTAKKAYEFAKAEEAQKFNQVEKSRIKIEMIVKRMKGYL